MGGCTHPELLDIRVFEESTKKAKYTQQTNEAKIKNISNCPMCAASGQEAYMKRIWKYIGGSYSKLR